MGLPARARARADPRGLRDRRDALERRALGHRRAAVVRRRALRLAAGRFARRHRPRAARRGLRAHPTHRRPHRLVLRQRSSGGCAASSTSSSAASGCAAAGATPSSSPSATRSISGASSATSPTGGCAWPPRCASRDAPGSSSRWRRRAGGSTIRQTAIFEPAGSLGPALLVRHLPAPCPRLPRHAARYRGRGGDVA